MRQIREGKYGVVVGLVAWGLTGLVLVGVVAMGVIQHVEVEKIRERLEKMEGEMMIMRDLVNKVWSKIVLLCCCLNF